MSKSKQHGHRQMSHGDEPQSTMERGRTAAQMDALVRDLPSDKGFGDRSNNWDVRPLSTMPLLDARPVTLAGICWPSWWKSWFFVIGVLVASLWYASTVPSVPHLHFPVQVIIIPAMMLMVAILVGLSNCAINKGFHVSVHPDGMAEWDKGKIRRSVRWADIAIGSADDGWDIFPVNRSGYRNTSRGFGFNVSVDGQQSPYAILLGFCRSKTGVGLADTQALRQCFFDALLAARPQLRIHPEVFTMLSLDPQSRAYAPWPKQRIILKAASGVAVFGGAAIVGLFAITDHMQRAQMQGIDMYAGFPPWYLVFVAWYCACVMMTTIDYV